MDLLADILKQAGLKTRILDHRVFHNDTAVEFPCSKSFGFHVVLQGDAFIHGIKGRNPLQLRKGDLALLSRGFDHIVSTEAKSPRAAQRAVKRTESSASRRGIIHVDEDIAGGLKTNQNAKPKLTLVSGAYQFWNTPVHPFFDEMPDWYVLRSEEIDSFDHLQIVMNLLAEEVTKPSVGTETVVQAYLDVIFTHIVRKILAAQGKKPKTWSHALKDAQIKSALELLHSDCARDWSLDEIAQSVGLSRAGFAQKFKTAMGTTPFHYLTTIRIQKAMDLLTNTPDKIESVAIAVGYKDAFSFSKVFKKITGIPPKDFRMGRELKVGG